METAPTIEPAFGRPSVNVLFIADANYVPYLAAAIVSLARHASPRRLYDVIVFNTGISGDDQAQLRALAGGRANISIRFLDVSAKIRELKERLGGLHANRHYPEFIYCRAFAPSILAAYDKIASFDSDVIFLTDVAGMFDIDLNGRALGASRCPICIWYLRKDPHGMFARQMKMRDARSYFNAASLVMDLNKMRLEKCEERCLKFLNEIPNPFSLDEGALNFALQGDVEYIDMAWNSFAWADALGRGPKPGDLPDDLYAEYRASVASPKILHYSSPSKPWNQPHIPLAGKFWEYAKETPYYGRLKLDDLKSLHENYEFLLGFLRPGLGFWLKLLYTFRVVMGKVTGHTHWLEAAKEARRQHQRLLMGRVSGVAVGWRGRFPWFTLGV